MSQKLTTYKRHPTGCLKEQEFKWTYIDIHTGIREKKNSFNDYKFDPLYLTFDNLNFLSIGYVICTHII